MSQWPVPRMTLLDRLHDPQDGDAWTEFVDLYGPLMFHFARRLPQDDDAADVLQEVLSAVMRCTYRRAGGRFQQWLVTVLLNGIRNFHAARSRRPVVSGGIEIALRLLLPCLDRSIRAPIDDLRSRGMDREILVVVLGEFGRTPKIAKPGPGREHWADADCVLLYGGGLTMGQVIVETDSRAERSKSGSISVENIFASMDHVHGIAPRRRCSTSTADLSIFSTTASRSRNCFLDRPSRRGARRC